MKNCMHEAVQGGKTRIMKYLHQFLLILAISFMGELLKEVLPFPVPASIYGMVILFVGLLSGSDSGWSGEGSRNVPDRDHAGYVYPGRSWSDGSMGNLKTDAVAGQCDYGDGCFYRNGSYRKSVAVGHREKAETGRFRR